MKDTKLKRQQLLSKFLCPFTCESTQPDNDCPFGHRTQPQLYHEPSMIVDLSYKCPLKPLPPYCCISFLALKCSKREYSFQCGAHSSAEILTRCEDGFHMELSEVDDLQLFAQKIAKVLLEASEICHSDSKFVGLVPVRNPIGVLKLLQSNSISAGQKRPRHEQIKDDENEDENDNSCAICLDQLKNNQSQIGHLDNCSHVFCAKCIHKWQNHGVNEGCPVCRNLITKILVWPKLLQTQEEKQKLFNLIRGEVPTDERVDREIAKGSLAYFTTSEGKTMRAYKMNSQNMKVFLKKPKTNWNCYVMTGIGAGRRVHIAVPVIQNNTSEGRNVTSGLRMNAYPGPITGGSNIAQNNAVTSNNATSIPATNPTATLSHWIRTGPNGDFIQIAQFPVNFAGVQPPVPVASSFCRQPTETNAATNNSAINNVTASVIVNANNFANNNSNTNNIAVIVNSNANNASTNNNNPSQHREIINVEDSDDDEVLLIGQSSN